MSTTKQLKETFRARDDQGVEYEVRVYVPVSRGNTTGGGSWKIEGLATGEATAMSGPLKGQTFSATFIGGDVYQVQHIGPGPKITRIR